MGERLERESRGRALGALLVKFVRILGAKGCFKLKGELERG